MLEIPRNLLNESSADPLSIAVVGVGNAGVSLIDRLAVAGFGKALDLVAINTDSVSLNGSVADRKVQIGQRTARGLGTGGDPEVGADSAEEAEADITDALGNCSLIVVCAGLGGGTGSGAAPIVAEIAKRRNALVLAMMTMPFPFEGRRRTEQADSARAELSKTCDALLVFENERMAEISEPLAGVHETFAASDQVLSEGIGFIARLALSSGPIRVTTSDLLAVCRAGGSTCAFGFAHASGGNRAHEAIERALKCPLMGRGKPLADARGTLVHISGPENLQLAEVRVIMDSIGKLTDGQVHLGIATDPDMRDTIGVAVLAPLGAAPPKRAAKIPTPSREPVRPAPAPDPVPVEEIALPTPPVPTRQEPAPSAASELFDTEPYRVEKVSTAAKKTPKPEQKTLSLDPVARGRFEKSEPTIIGGEDLDVPTFLRRKIKLR